MINATTCLLKYKGQTLFISRNKGVEDMHHGFHVPPGGKTKRGERGIDCVVREFKEETGLTLLHPRLRAIATFYNQGRILGGQENPEDWCVEIYEAHDYFGQTKEEHSKAKLIWIRDADLKTTRMYPGDRKILELLAEEGVFEILTRYHKEELLTFEYTRVV